MTFAEAVRHCLSNYISLDGRARRSEYWWWTLFTVILAIVGTVVDVLVGTNFGNSGYGVISLLIFAAIFLPSIAVTVRRLHDTGRSGGWFFISFVPLVGAIVIFIFAVLDSEPDANKYGPSPKYGDRSVYA